jgi:phosphatidylinositol-3-phosphatase
MNLRTRAGVLAACLPLVLAPALAGCSSITGAHRAAELPGQVAATAPDAGGPGYDKVLLIVEEDASYDEVMDNPAAGYVRALAQRYGSALAADAGYPVDCPGLPAYLLLTSGDTHGICDDRDPSGQWLDGPNLFQQTAQAGLQWRSYAESMPASCTPVNTGHGIYLVRHAPATYYSSESQRCRHWHVPLGTATSGALHDDLAHGLPAFSIVTPDACHDWQGLPPCTQDPAATGDAWLHTWIPQILAGPDYSSGRLAVVITWDEGSQTDNHVATLVISPTTSAVASLQPYTHCSTLRAVEEILGLGLLGCAAGAPSLRPDFGL